MKSSKGSAFERDICRRLSLWCSETKTDDLFWRTGGSGGRAKVRGRGGRRTTGQHGDITSTDASSQPLIDLVTIELKRGYGTKSIYDILDKSKKAAKQEWEKWFEQVVESATQSGTPFWWLIHKRDKREPVIFFSADFYSAVLKVRGKASVEDFPGWGCMKFRWYSSEYHQQETFGMQLEYFLSRVSWKTIQVMHKTYCGDS